MKIKQLVKRWLKSEQVSQLKNFKGVMRSRLYGVLTKSRRLTSLYWGIFSTSFTNEHYGVVYGIARYARELCRPHETQYLLRRNIHRLEKGLLMRARRDVFALDYIEETVDRYVQIVTNTCSGDTVVGELRWAHDLLVKYFSVVAVHPVIDRARARFESFSSTPLAELTCVPYKRNLDSPATVTYDDFLALSQRRRSVRWYLPQPVPREIIDKAIAAAALAPSACNRQPFEFRVFDEPALVQQISPLPGGTTGFYENFPVIVVLVGKLSAYFAPMDRHLIYIDASLAAMAFMYALETLGLSSCAINWHDEGSREKKMARLLKLTPDERVVMLISLGYPDPEGMVAYSDKKPLDLLRRYN